MKIKVGDKIKVRNDLVLDKKYNYISCLDKMLEFKGKTVTVKNILSEDIISIEEDEYNFSWGKDMFEPIAEEKHKFQIGDIVKIVNTFEEYEDSELIKSLMGEEFYNELWDDTDTVSCEYLYEIEEIVTDERDGRNIDIYVISDKKSKEHYYLIGENGIEKAVTKIGQKAIINSGSYKNVQVTVCDIRDNLFYTNNKFIGCKFSRKAMGRHSCNGHCEDGRGYYYSPRELTLIEDIIEDEKKEEEELKENEEVKKLTKEITKLTNEIRKRERFQDLMNEAVIEKGKEIAVEDLKEKLKEELDTFIEEKYGVLPKRIEVVTEKSKRELQGIFHKDFEKICKLVNSNIPVMLTGGAGAGKNYTLEQVAEALDLDFYFSNAVNQEYKLTGFVDANGTYHETEFYKAFVRGGMFFLDEIDASSPECLVILNSAIANKYFDFPTGRVKAHENFRVVCAGNTYGTGADMVYVGRNVLDGATLDRFVVVPFDYDENVEKQLAYDMELYNFIYNLRKAVNECNLRYIVSMRALINASKMLELGLGKQEILKTAIIKNMQIDDLNTIYNKLPNSEWKDELDKYIKRGDYV